MNLNLPLYNQLSGGDVNIDDDCGSACIASVCQWNSGHVLNPGTPKDVAYGANYIGETDFANYQAFTRPYGITMYKQAGLSDAAIVAHIHALVAAGHPVLCYVPWENNDAVSHCVAFYEESPGELTAMNPWGGYAWRLSDETWIQRGFFYGLIWVVTGDRKNMGIPTGWKKNAAGALVAPNGVIIRNGFEQCIETHSWDAGNIPQEAEYNVPQVLLHNPAVGGGDRQVFRDSLLWWTQAKGVVNEPYMGLELDAAYKRIAQLEQQSAQPAPAPSSAAHNAAQQAIAILQKI